MRVLHDEGTGLLSQRKEETCAIASSPRVVGDLDAAYLYDAWLESWEGCRLHKKLGGAWKALPLCRKPQLL
jgi:hypothetical protein